MKLYIVTRSDIPPGLMMAQAVHAGRAFGDPVHGENLACLEVPGEPELLELIRKAICRDIPHTEFREPDLDGTVTSVAFRGPTAHRILSNLPLALRTAHRSRLADVG